MFYLKEKFIEEIEAKNNKVSTKNNCLSKNKKCAQESCFFIRMKK